MNIRITLLFAAMLAPLASAPIALSSTFTVSTISDAGFGSLRQAIIDANAHVNVSGPDVIAFKLGGSGVQSITPRSALPVITDPVVIDGYTQSGASPNTAPSGQANNATLLVRLNGNGGDFVGLFITGDGTTVRGLIINLFGRSGIVIQGGGNNVIEGNYIGTNFNGTAVFGNGVDGIFIENSANNRIGGTAVSSPNLISGNGIAAKDPNIFIGGISATGNVIQGNLIGTDATGTQALGGGGAGIFLAGAPDNVIGGTNSSSRNVISGNALDGILFGTATVGNNQYLGRDCTGNVVEGNFIGTGAGGTQLLGNGRRGVAIVGGSNNFIGAISSKGANVIADNGTQGVSVLGLTATGNRILSNSIYANQSLGIDLKGDGPTPNHLGGAIPGPNNLQNFPFISSVSFGSGTITLNGTLNSTSNETFTLQFFSEPQGRNQPAQLFLGSAALTTDNNGSGSYSATFPLANPATAVTATATDSNGNTSEFATYGVPIVVSPQSAIATVGQAFTYQVVATNSPTRFSGTGLPAGLTFNSFLGVITGVPTTAGASQISFTATNSLGTGNGSLALTVQPAPPAGPVIISGTCATGRTNGPFSFQVITIGGSPAARLSAKGLPPTLTFDPVSGLISGTSTSDGSFGITLTVTSGNFSTTATLQLTFTSDPEFPVIISPGFATITLGQFFTYTIGATGSAAPSDPTIFRLIGTLPNGLSFDQKTGTISGVFSGLGEQGEGPPDVKELSGGIITNVQLFAKNAHGTGTIPLFFLAPPPGLVNISTRIAVGTSENVLIGGFIITGNAPKKVILRAIGPSLTANGQPVPGALQDPTLELHDGAGAVVGSNEDWRSSQENEIIATTIPPSDNRESAILAILQSSNYTAIVGGKNNSAGIGLVEVYDLGTASLDAGSKAQLAEISTRGNVLTADDVMIGGFIVSGATTKVIVRAIGPELTTSGISGALQDTVLELHNGSGSLVASNDDWRSNQEQPIIDTTVPPGDDRESAIVASLSPGGYTAIVRGKNDTTGVALVEVYALP